MPNSSSVKRAFVETPHRRIDDGTDRTGQSVLRLPETPRSSNEHLDVIPGSRAVPIPGGMVPVGGQMPEAGAAAGVGLLQGNAE
jgi:hypothetical protein